MTSHGYDFVVIGAGSAGTAAAVKADELGARTLLVNGGLPLGGTCPNVGCVPSKALLAAAETLHAARPFLPDADPEAGGAAFSRAADSTARLVRKMRKTRYERVVARLRNVTLHEGSARFLGPGLIDVDGQRVETDRTLIACGSTATVPGINGLLQTGFITHIEALSLRTLPSSVAIIGGGPLGLEFAQMFTRFGVRVTLLQRGPHVLPAAEPLLTERLTEALRSEGIRILTGVDVAEVGLAGDDKVVHFSVEGERAQEHAEEVMLAAGKTANTATLGLDEVGVETDERASVRVDADLRTSAEGIWAAGDVAALPRRLETSSAREGSFAAENALTGSRKTVDYTEIPYAVFTDPQLAAVGQTEAEQERAVGRCECRAVFFNSVPKAQILNRREGVVKMVIDPEDRTVRGVHVLAPGAADLIAQAMTMVHERVGVDDVVSSYPVFPTLSEAIKYAAIAFSRNVDDMPCCI